MSSTPEHFGLSLLPRARQIVAAARVMLEDVGWEGVSMRPLADGLGIRAPSIYKHFANRDHIKAALVTQGLIEMGAALHGALAGSTPVHDLLAAYRAVGLAHPNLYRLTTAGPLSREQLPDGLEEWSGSPFFLVTGDATVAQALWSFAHGMMILELDGRYPPGSDLDRTWAVGAARFTVGPR